MQIVGFLMLRLNYILLLVASITLFVLRTVVEEFKMINIWQQLGGKCKYIREEHMPTPVAQFDPSKSLFHSCGDDQMMKSAIQNPFIPLQKRKVSRIFMYLITITLYMGLTQEYLCI